MTNLGDMTLRAPRELGAVDDTSLLVSPPARAEERMESVDCWSKKLAAS